VTLAKKYFVRWRRIRSSGWPTRWHTAGPVIGHNFEKLQDKVVLYFEDGSIREIAKWVECEIDLRTDWVLAQKDQMEREANQPIKLNVNVGEK
jgi:hypothetical protein